MVSHRRGRFFGRRSGFSVTPKKKISALTKFIYILSLGLAVVLGCILYYEVYYGKGYLMFFGGAGFLCLYLGLVTWLVSMARVKRDTEPLIARILAVALSLCSFAIWGAIYVLGMIRG